jgi:uncharacterized membrane protein
MLKDLFYSSLVIYFGLLLLIALLCPIFEFQRSPLAPICYNFLKNFCHQIPSRCLWVLDSNVGLCSRCFSFYLSFIVWSIFLISSKKQYLINFKKTFPVGLTMVFPLIADGSVQLVTNYPGNNCLRLVTGILAGLGIALLGNNLFRTGRQK